MRTLNLLTITLLGAVFAAAQPCSPADARGAYLFKVWGWQDLGPSHPALPNTMGPSYGLGVVTLDGAGGGGGRYTFTLGGVAQTLEFVDLRYAVSENCGATATYRLKVAETGSVVGPDKMELQIMEDGARLSGLITASPGRTAILAGELTRMSRGPRACHASMVRGTYAMRYEGWLNMQMLNPNQAPYFAPELGLGVVVLNPEGANTGAAAHNWGGMQFATELVSGIFAINPDCTGVFDYVIQMKGSPSKMTGKSVFVMTGDGAKLTVLMTSTPALQYYERVSIP